VLGDVERFIAYRVKPGDSVASISEQGGSAPDLLMRYNRLTDEPQIGRELMIPHLRGKTSDLPDSWLLVVEGNTRKPWVALTFDCGGQNPRAHDILDTLRDADLQVTFFLLGNSIIDDPDLLRRMVADGHELANHSYTHADFTTLTDEEIGEELRYTEEAVQSIVGPDVSIRPYLRLPYGSYDKRTLRAVAAQGYIPVHWTLDALDSFGEPKTPEFLVDRLTTTLPPEEMHGAIILTHCMSSTADALPAILQRFDEMGLQARTVSEVLGP
jgi:peptidoglycan/xylan/chitin deacetylase (PgdA/CDA1 family)